MGIDKEIKKLYKRIHKVLSIGMFIYMILMFISVLTSNVMFTVLAGFNFVIFGALINYIDRKCYRRKKE